MGVTQALGRVEDPRFNEHRPASDHPEHPRRLAAVARGLDAAGVDWVPIAAREASDAELLAAHSRAQLERVARAAQAAPAHLDPDTYVAPGSERAARLAAGGAIELARAVLEGRVRAGFAAVRPPGHHAEADRAMGFCLYNNVAVAARALQREGLARLLIVDWDVHHGNGTQRIFEQDGGVLYFSTHQFPFYPGTGAAEECGRGAGRGATVNVPLPAGCGDAEYVGVFDRVLVPVARRFSPELILVSCGFDPHRDDPLASMEVTREGFLAMARRVRRLAEELCEGRLVVVLEGGYASRGLLEGASAVAQALAEPAAGSPVEDEATVPVGSPVLADVVGRVARAQRELHPEIEPLDPS